MYNDTRIELNAVEFNGILNLNMSKLLIATIYNHYSIVSTINKFSINKLIILSDESPNETIQKSIDLIGDAFQKAIEIKILKIDLYNIVKIASQVVDIIDNIEEKDEIYIDITSGRKPKSLGLLFGVYSRSKRIKKIMYVTEDTNEIITLPKMAYTINATERDILTNINNDKNITTIKIADRLGLSKAMVYRYIKTLIEIDAIEKDGEQVILTDFGEILLL